MIKIIQETPSILILIGILFNGYLITILNIFEQYNPIFATITSIVIIVASISAMYSLYKKYIKHNEKSI